MTSSTTASTTSSCRAPSRCSSSTTSPPAASRPTWRRRSWRASSTACRENGCALHRRRDGRDARLLRARASTTSPGFIVGVVERDRARSTARRSRRGDALLGLPSTGPAHQRLLAGPRDRLRARSGSRPTPVVDELGLHRSARSCSRVHRSYLPVVRPLLEARARQGPGAHHRRRHHREPAAHPPAGHRPRSIDRSAWTARRRLPLPRSAPAACRTTTCTAPSTWGSA
ncbi:MAG: hypothetical protein MZV64_04650 [Ignavibacteriales bacterium]|nr:hypothetical protein [Ignavibacteriales bacterium]